MRPENPLLSTKEVARILGIHYLTVMKHIRKGNIRHVRYGKLYKVSQAEVERIQRDGLPMNAAAERIALHEANVENHSQETL